MSKFTFFLVAVLIALPLPISAAGLKIAVVAPQSGNLQVLGRQVIDGATLAAKDRAELVMIDESCADNFGPDVAAKIRASGAAAAIGFLCSQSLDGGLPLLAQAKNTARNCHVFGSMIATGSWYGTNATSPWPTSLLSRSSSVKVRLTWPSITATLWGTAWAALVSMSPKH